MWLNDLFKKGKQADKQAVNAFVDVIREMIQTELEKRDNTAICQIQAVNYDGTVNIYLLPDRETIIENIINGSKYDFAAGDYAVLYKLNNQIGNSFIITKINP